MPRGPSETGAIVASTCYKDTEDNSAKRLAVHQAGSVFAVTGPDGCRLFDMRMLSDASNGGQTRCLYTCRPRTEVQPGTCCLFHPTRPSVLVVSDT